MPSPPTSAERFAVVKLGGSLLDKPRLVPQLSNWLARYELPPVIVVGGGPAADWIRRVDAVHALPAECAHWLAIETMRLNARWLAAILPSGVLVSDWPSCRDTWRQNRFPVLDPLPFCQQDATLPDALPVGWHVTSDSIAAQLAYRWQAAELILLKACPRPPGDWQTLAHQGLIDAYFPQLVTRLPPIRWLPWPNL